MKEQFINRYPISKTLQFSLIPVGKTEENFEKNMFLEKDEKRAEEYEKVKSYMDRYHKFFIDTVLNSDIQLNNLNEYANLYWKNTRTDDDTKNIEKLEENFRLQISKNLKNHPLFKKMFSEEMIKTVLPSFLSDAAEKASVKTFLGFFTYFSGFNKNRENMYTSEAQSTSIAYRCINDNLPKFLDNIKLYEKIKESIPKEKSQELDNNAITSYGRYVSDIFSIDYFSFVLSQSGIDIYNGIISGYSCSDGTKIQGLNEIINLYNQQVAKKDKSKKLPLFKTLYKQILSDRCTLSFIPEKFSNDDELISSVNSFYTDVLENCLNKINMLFIAFGSLDSSGIYVKSGIPITDLSNNVFGIWSAISSAWNKEYEIIKPLKKGKNIENYYDEMAKEYKKIGSFSISRLQMLGEKESVKEHPQTIADYYSSTVSEKVSLILSSYKSAYSLLTDSYSSTHSTKLCNDNNSISLLKTLMDAVKELEQIIKPLLGTGKEDNKNDLFYGEFLPLYESLSTFDRLYDKVRNYITQKPYSNDKIKLNFDNPQLLGGWDKNKERDYRTVLLRKEGIYYLAIMDKSNNKIFQNPPIATDEDSYEKMDYKLLPGPNKMLPKVFFAESNIKKFAPSEKIMEIYQKESFKKGSTFSIDDCHAFIDFYKASIEKHSDWSLFHFKFSPTETYNDISEFFREISDQGYMINFSKIPSHYINSFVNSGELYLFKLYSKDFSEFSHGAPNLHTLFFKLLFDDRNLANLTFKLNGEAEMFYRKASITDSEKIIHPANQPINNKNPKNQKKQSVFEYDLIKNKRFTTHQFSIHIPITINYRAHDHEIINNAVRIALKHNETPYVIGIDRGERNLLYVSVIDKDGKIVEQMSLNEIISDNNYKVDYRSLLDAKEKERNNAHQSWGTIENIKELKEGYLSQVVHKICELVVKYDAIIAMEDLNFGFKRGRFSVEKQVYQKFENMLISKLNFLCDKKKDIEEEGGLLKAYQLTNKFDGVNKGRQNGIIFYVPAWLTSKIDPETGFVNLLNPKYTNIEDAKKLFNSFDNIRYNAAVDMFEFDIDYSKFPYCNADYKKNWTVCTNSSRIITFRNPQKNNEWDNKSVILTEEFKNLFAKYDIDYSNNLQKSILAISNCKFFNELIKLLSYTLQMRNSETGNVDVDYLISPVKNKHGKFYNSNEYKEDANASLPKDADANGAYNIARKALWAIDVLKNTPDDKVDKADLSISNAKWLEYAQKHI